MQTPLMFSANVPQKINFKVGDKVVWDFGDIVTNTIIPLMAQVEAVADEELTVKLCGEFVDTYDNKTYEKGHVLHPKRFRCRLAD